MADESNIGSINFTVEARTRNIDEASDSINRLGNESDKADKQAGKLNTGMKNLAAGAANFALVAAGTAAAVAGIVGSVASVVKENDVMARVLGISTTALQEFQAAAKTVNIESDKMSDIFKDVQDKIGEAFQEGTGEGAAALELLGLKAKDLINLPVDQKLEKIGEALGSIDTRAGQISIMEMLANDGSLLLPILDNNNEKLKELRQRAIESGQALSEFDNTALVQLSNNISEISANASGLTRTLSAELSPVIIVAQGYIKDMISAFSKDDIQSFVEFGVKAIGVLLDVVQTYEMYLRAISIAWAGVRAAAIDAMASSADAVSDLINKALWPLQTVLAKVAEGWSIITGALASITPGEISKGFQSASDSLKSFAKDAKDFKVTADDIRSANDAAKKSLDDQIAALDKLANSPAYSEQFKAKIKEVREQIQKKADASKREREEQNKATDAVTKATAEQERQNKENKKAAESIKNLVNPLRKIAIEYEKAKALFEKGLITEDEFQSFITHLGKVGKEIADEMSDAGEDSGKKFIEEFSKSLSEAAAGGGFGGVISMLGDKLGESLGASMSSSISNALGGSSGALLGGVAGGLMAGAVQDLVGRALGGVKRETISTGFDIEIVGNTIAEAFSTEKIKRSGFFSSSVEAYKEAVSDVTLESIKLSFSDVSKSIENEASSLGIEMKPLSETISVESGDLSSAIDLAATRTIDASVPAIEKFSRVGDDLVDVFAKLASDADIVNESISATGISMSSVDAAISASANSLSAAYQSQLSDLIEELDVARADLSTQRGISGSIGYVTAESDLDAYNRRTDARGAALTLEKEIAKIEESITEVLSRIGGVAGEAAIKFDQDILKAISEINGISIDDASKALIALSESYAENFFSADEKLAKAVTEAEKSLSAFADLGISVETTIPELRSVIEDFSSSDAFTAEGYARYISAADALSKYVDATQNAKNATEKAKESIADRERLERKLFNLTASVSEKRELELSLLDDSSKEIQKRIWSLEDESAAVAEADKAHKSYEEALKSLASIAKSAAEDMVEASESAMKTALSDYRSAVEKESDKIAESASDQIRAIRDTMKAERELAESRLASAKSTLSSLRNVKSATSSALSSLSSGVSLDFINSGLNDVLSKVLAGESFDPSVIGDLTASFKDMSADQFSSDQDMAHQQAVVANKLQSIDSATDKQISIEEKMVQSLEDQIQQNINSESNQIAAIEQSRDDQIAVLEHQFQELERQTNALLGIDDSVKDVSSAIAALMTAIQMNEVTGTLSNSGAGTGAGGSVTDADIQWTINEAISRLGETEQAWNYLYDRARSLGVSISRIDNFLPGASEWVERSGLPMFSSGGYTGGAGINDVAGIVHGQEFVLNSSATSRIGIGALGAMNSGMNPSEIFGKRDTLDQSLIINELRSNNEMMSIAYTQLIADQKQILSILDDVTDGSSLRVVQ